MVRGPVPKREEDLARPRSRGQGAAAPVVTRGELRPVEIPETPSDWHPIAQRLFDGMKTSGQADFMQNSDWALAYSLCDDLSRYKIAEDRTDEMNRKRDMWFALSPEEREELGMDPKMAPPAGGKGGSAMKLNAVMDGLSRLMVAEADRRRLHIELQAPTSNETSASVVAIDDYKKKLGMKK